MSIFPSFGALASATKGVSPFIAVGSNTGMPYTFTGGTNYVTNCKTCHKIIYAVNSIKFTFANFVLSAQGELLNGSVNGYYDFVLRAGIKVNGVFYRLTFGGLTEVTVPFGTYVTCDPLVVNISAGTIITVYNRRVAVAGQQGYTNFNVLASHATHVGFGEGTLAGTNTTLDYTIGGVPGGDVSTITLSNAAGVITPTIVNAAGSSGYTSTPSISVLDPQTYGTSSIYTANIVSNAIQASGQAVITTASTTNIANGMLVGGHSSIPGGTTVLSFVANTSITLSANLTGTIANGVTIGFMPAANWRGGVGFAATATQSAGTLTGAIGNTGFPWGFSSRTVASLSGGGGFGASTQAYGPSIISGTPTSSGKVSLLLQGNSITVGRGASEAYGDENRSFGVWERAWKAAYGAVNVGYVGNELVSIKGTNYATTYAMIASAFRATHTFVCGPTNDIVAGFTLANIQSYITQIVTREHGLGRKVITETNMPRTTSSDNWVTTANQTPVAGYAVGDIADQYDTWLLAGNSGADYVVDVRASTRDGTLTDRWRVDQGRFTSDGIHPLQIDYLAGLMNAFIPALSA